MEGTSETAPLKPSGNSSPFLPVSAAGRTFGTTYFLVSTTIASIIPILQLLIGLYYKGQCPVDQRIATYMIVAGACGLALVALSIFLALTFMYLISDSTILTIFASCGICLNILATIVISIFMFIWFILGCVWVFGANDRVQFSNPKLPDYCEAILYKWAFALLVITILWAAIQCCISCFRTCCTGQSS